MSLDDVLASSPSASRDDAGEPGQVEPPPDPLGSIPEQLFAGDWVRGDDQPRDTRGRYLPAPPPLPSQNQEG